MIRTIRWLRLLLPLAAAIIYLTSPGAIWVQAAPASPGKQPPAPDPKQLLTDRKHFYDSMSLLTGMPWYDLAAIDQYERSLNKVKKRPVRADALAAIYFTEAEWAGLLNPDYTDRNPRTLSIFGGKGRDGSGDGLADRTNDQDVMIAMTEYLRSFGTSREDFQIGLWEYYQNSRSVERIMQFSALYAEFGTIELNQHAFPLPLSAVYSYRSTWGASRGWGGDRIHEGTDIFADYGVPVRSTCYGVIEEMGWNSYGGWRIGIRDINSVYHYYAHMSGFNKQIKQGDIVSPGQQIGRVGSSGYGKPGTQGKFPPHLHFGLYRDNGLSEWPFDPYPSLSKWEREEAQRKPAAGK